MFSTETLSVLKNFSSINQAILFKPGNFLSTVSLSSAVLARARIKEEIPRKFAIADLAKFLSVMGLFQSPTIDFQEKRLVIKEGKTGVSMLYAEPKTIKYPSSDELSLAKTKVSFYLEKEVWAGLQKAMALLSVPEMVVESDGKSISIKAVDSTKPSSNYYSIDLMEAKDGDRYKYIFRAENLRLIGGTGYTVNIGGIDGETNVGHFKGDNIEYWIAIEHNSEE